MGGGRGDSKEISVGAWYLQGAHEMVHQVRLVGGPAFAALVPPVPQPTLDVGVQLAHAGPVGEPGREGQPHAPGPQAALQALLHDGQVQPREYLGSAGFEIQKF